MFQPDASHKLNSSALKNWILFHFAPLLNWIVKNSTGFKKCKLASKITFMHLDFCVSMRVIWTLWGSDAQSKKSFLVFAKSSGALRT